MNLGVKSVHSKSWTRDIERIFGEIESIRGSGYVVRTYPHAVADLDGETVLDLDGQPVYDIGSILDNPVSQVLVFDTVAEMLEFPGELIDEAVTLNWDGADGNTQQWVMISDPRIVPNGTTEFESQDHYGTLRTYTCRGKEYGSQFATRDDVESAVAVLRADRYTHNQGVPSSTWIVSHNLGRVPSVTVEDSYGRQIFGAVRTISLNQTEISFAAARSGSAYFS